MELIYITELSFMRVAVAFFVLLGLILWMGLMVLDSKATKRKKFIVNKGLWEEYDKLHKAKLLKLLTGK